MESSQPNGDTRFTAPRGITPMRLDVFLMRHTANCSRRQAQRAVASGCVRVNGRRARKSDLVREGDVVAVPAVLFDPVALSANADVPVALLYEDAAVIAVDKPAGIPSHALRAHETDTVANFLLAHFPEVRAVGARPLEAGLVHRLDTDTSGVLLAARVERAYAGLREQFSRKAVRKEYCALVHGEVRSGGDIRIPIGHAAHNRRKMRVVASLDVAGARPAETTYRVTQRFGAYTLLDVRIRTGVMHQIRVHLAAIGHPVVGDQLYGYETPRMVTRQLLHAVRLGFVHPLTGQPMEIGSPLPADFREQLDRLTA